MSQQIFTLPDLGEGLAEAELVRWLVSPGDTIAVDAPVAEVETAKATVEVPSPFGGVIAALHGIEGATIAVGSPLITVEDGAQAPTAPTQAPADTYRTEERAGSGNVLIGYGTSASTPSRRRRSLPSGPATIQAAEPPATVPTLPAPAAPANGSVQAPAVQSPVVRALARTRGVDLATVRGSGPDGVITRADVEAATVKPDVAPTDALPTPTAATGSGDTDRRTGLAIRSRIPIRGLRKTVAATLTRSRSEIPEATTWVDVDATELLVLRQSWTDRCEAPGVLAMVARFVIAGLARYPELNAKVDTDNQEIVHLDGVNLGIAAQTDRGLVVPAIRDAHRLSTRALHSEIKRLTTAARDGSTTTDELTSGSFTLNNYGVLGVDGSAAIINHPEVAILGMGRIFPRPWVVGDQIVARRIVQLSLVFDHRVCDGGTAGGFLRFVADAIENPTSAWADL